MGAQATKESATSRLGHWIKHVIENRHTSAASQRWYGHASREKAASVLESALQVRASSAGSTCGSFHDQLLSPVCLCASCLWFVPASQTSVMCSSSVLRSRLSVPSAEQRTWRLVTPWTLVTAGCGAWSVAVSSIWSQRASEVNWRLN